MAQRAYCGAFFTLVDEGVLIVTSTGTHTEERKEFFKTAHAVLEASTEKRNYFIEPNEALNMGV